MRWRSRTSCTVFHESIRHGPIPSVRFGCDRRVEDARWGTPRTRRVTESGSGSGRVESAGFKRRAGCKPLLRLGIRHFADARWTCDYLRHAAFCSHTPRTANALHQSAHSSLSRQNISVTTMRWRGSNLQYVPCLIPITVVMFRTRSWHIYNTKRLTRSLLRSPSASIVPKHPPSPPNTP